MSQIQGGDKGGRWIVFSKVTLTSVNFYSVNIDESYLAHIR